MIVFVGRFWLLRLVGCWTCCVWIFLVLVFWDWFGCCFDCWLSVIFGDLIIPLITLFGLGG